VGAFPDGAWDPRVAKGRPLSSRNRRFCPAPLVVEEEEGKETKLDHHTPMRAQDPRAPVGHVLVSRRRWKERRPSLESGDAKKPVGEVRVL
jgi:hypothetical protein